MRMASVILLLMVLFSIRVSAGYSFEESITVAEPRISLASLAGISEDEELWEILSLIDLGPAPGWKEERKFSRQYLEFLLRREGIDAEKWDLPDGVTVKTDLGIIEEEELKRKTRELLQKKIPELIVDFPRDVSKIYYPRGEFQPNLEIGENLRIPGNNTVTLVLSSKGGVWERRRIVVFLDREIQVFRAVSTMESHEKVKKELFEIELIRESKLPRGFIPAEQKLEGLRLRRSLNAGSILCSHHLEAVPLIERGEGVTIKILSKGFSISLPGEAMESGNKGETIRVRNLFSGEVMQGKILGERKIEIDI